MPAVLRDLELTKVWTLAPSRPTVIGPRGGLGDRDIKLDDWGVGRVELTPQSGAWLVSSQRPSWSQSVPNGHLSTGERRSSPLTPDAHAIESGDVLFLGRETTFLFFLEEGEPAEIVEPMAAARPLFEAARATIDAGSPEWAERLTRRFAECRESGRIEALADIASAAALEPGSLARRSAAVVVLAEVGRQWPATVRHLRLLLSDPERELRIATARALARIGGPNVVDALAAALRDVDDRVFLTSLAAIERSRDPIFRQPLFEILRDAKGKRREHLERAISELAGEN